MIQGKRGDPDKGALYPTQFNCQRLSQPLRGIYHEDKYGLIIIFVLEHAYADLPRTTASEGVTDELLQGLQRSPWCALLAESFLEAYNEGHLLVCSVISLLSHAYDCSYHTDMRHCRKEIVHGIKLSQSGMSLNS